MNDASKEDTRCNYLLITHTHIFKLIPSSFSIFRIYISQVRIDVYQSNNVLEVNLVDIDYPQKKTSRPKCWQLLQERWKYTNEAYFWRTYTWNSLWHFVKRPRYFIWLLFFLPVIGWKKEWLGNLKKKARTRAISFKTVEIAQRQKSMESGSVEAQRSIMIMIIITGLDQLLM